MVANRHIKLFLFVGQDQEQHPAVHSRGIIREKFCGCGAFIEFGQKGQFHTVSEYRKSKKHTQTIAWTLKLIHPIAQEAG